ncbi:MAG: hypothetical protein M3R49_08805 [Chloroflexota bacterium]|nr:hypothetical protein [Chloroflexota bacterium]
MSASRGTASVESLAATCAILTGLAGLLYSLAFLGLVVAGLAPGPGVVISSVMLLLGGLLSSFVLFAVYERVRPAGPMLARWALALGLAGALGAALHGGYDLANAINPPASDPIALANLPSPIDPRGLLTFGVSGAAAFVVAMLIRRGGTLPRGLGSLGMVAAILLILTYLGRLIVLTPTNPLVAGPAALVGLIVNPTWYIWLGRSLRRTPGSNL